MSLNVAAEITEEEFEAYVDIQRSGEINMSAVSTVADWSGLEKEQCLYIMKHYSELEERYPEVADS